MIAKLSMRVVAAGVAVSCLAATGAAAQFATPPALVQADTLPIAARRNASDFKYAMQLVLARQEGDIPIDAAFPKDSLHGAAVTRAREFLNALQRQPATGIQTEPAAWLSVFANADTLALRQFETRLAAPGLSAADRAYTYYAAVEAFGDADRPDRLKIAESYLTKLEKMGNTVTPLFRFRAHALLATAYDLRGDDDDALRHGLALIHIVPELPYPDRMQFFQSDHYLAVANILGNRPNGRAKLDSIEAFLTPLTQPQAGIDATSPFVMMMARVYGSSLESQIAMGKLIGATAPPVQATTWINRPTAAGDVQFNDGKIRVVLFGDFSSSSTIDALYGLRRVQSRFPSGVETLYITTLRGYLGTEFLAPAAEAARLKTLYTDSLKVTLPIALWVGDKIPNGMGGSVPARNPSYAAYKVRQVPHVCVIDGKGIVRRVFHGFSREMEPRTIAYIASLGALPTATASTPASKASQ